MSHSPVRFENDRDGEKNRGEKKSRCVDQNQNIRNVVSATVG